MGALGLTGHATQFDRGVPFGSRPRDHRRPAARRRSEAVGTVHAARVRSLLDATTPGRLLAGTEVRPTDHVPRDVLSALFDLVTQLAEVETVVMVSEDLHEAAAIRLLC